MANRSAFAAHGVRARVGKALVALAGVAMLAFVAIPATTAGAQSLGQAVKVTAPADAGTDPFANLFAVSCPSAGNCAGVGNYGDSSGHQQAMQASETSGVWGQAAKVTAPPGAAPDAVAPGRAGGPAACDTP